MSHNKAAKVTLVSKFRTKEGKSYSYWRLRILYSTIIGYASFLLVRNNLAFAIPGITEEFNYSSTQIGLILTLFSIIYGVGKFINGYLSDNSNARYFMSIGLFVSGLLSIVISFQGGLLALAVWWSINGWTQSMGAAPSARLLTHWFSPKELGTKWSIWSCSHQIGNATVAALAGFLVLHYGWRYAFAIPGILACLLSVFLFNRLRDTPKEIGLPEVEIYKDDVINIVPQSAGKLSMKDTIRLVFKNKFVWYITFAGTFLYIPRNSILLWGPKFLKDLKGYNILEAGGQMIAYDIAGMLGALFAGWLSDKLFKGNRGPIATIYLLLLAVTIYAIWRIPAGYPLIDAIALALTGFLISGPQVLAGLALADFASKKAVGVATGFSGAMNYIFGAALSGVGIGKVVDIWGWQAGFTMLIVCALIGAFFFGLTCFAQHKK